MSSEACPDTILGSGGIDYKDPPRDSGVYARVVLWGFLMGVVRG